MVLITSMITGLFAAMLRSVSSLIVVTFLITALFAVSFIMNGTSFLSLILAIAGFNAGLILFSAAYIFGPGARQM